MFKFFLIYLFSICIVFSQTKYTISKEKNLIKWKGSPSMGLGQVGMWHEGTLKINSGIIETVENQQISKGNFEMDMSTIKDESTNAEKSKNLSEHLKSSDFFDVSRFPKANFMIEKTLPIPNNPTQFSVSGFLTMKGITNKITFPAEIIFDSNVIKVKADLWINRQLWKITYNSPGLFSSAKEVAIANEIYLKLDLIFVK